MTGEPTPAPRALGRDRVGVAVVGYGYWGPNLARTVSVSDAAELTAVCDLDEARRARAAKHHPGARMTAEWDSVLEDEAVDAVALALPVPLHYRFAMEALSAGKHVLVEKPLAETVAQCDDLVREAAGRRVVLMPGHTFEFNAAVQAVGDYIDRGELGDVYYVSMRRTNLGIVRSDINAMWSLAPHDVSILLSWLRLEPLSVTAVGVGYLQPGIEDVVFMTIRFEGDVMGHIHASWLEPNKVRDATVVGSRKMAVYDDTSPDLKVWIYDKGIQKQEVNGQASLGRYEDFARFQMIARAGDVVAPKVEFREPLALQFEHFAQCVLTGRPPRIDGESGRRVVGVLEAAQRSLDNGGTSEAIDLAAARRVAAVASRSR